MRRDTVSLRGNQNKCFRFPFMHKIKNVDSHLDSLLIKPTNCGLTRIL